MEKVDPVLPTFEALQRQIKEERERRIARHQLAVIERHFLKRRKAGSLNILAHGDSWFDYPLSADVIDFLRADPSRPEILCLAHYGDASTTALGVTKRQQLIDNLTATPNGAFDALLFSGGGDDIAGDQFCLWVRPFDPSNPDPTHGIDNARLWDLMQVVQAAYVDLIGVCKAIQPECILFLHAYDFAQPNGVPACWVGPWLKPSLDFRGWTDPALAAQLVKNVLLAFDSMLTQLESDYKNVVYVRTQGTLNPKTEWANEVHPTEPGFAKIAARFRDALSATFPGRI
jgi:hypothetical protein